MYADSLRARMDVDAILTKLVDYSKLAENLLLGKNSENMNLDHLT